MECVQVDKFPFLGRAVEARTSMRDATFESKAYGKRVNKIISIEGRVQFDLLQVMVLSYSSVSLRWWPLD